MPLAWISSRRRSLPSRTAFTWFRWYSTPSMTTTAPQLTAPTPRAMQISTQK